MILTTRANNVPYFSSHDKLAICSYRLNDESPDLIRAEICTSSVPLRRFPDDERRGEEDFAGLERGVAHALDERGERGFGDAVARLADRRELRGHDGRNLHVVETGKHDILENLPAEPRQRLTKPGRSLVVAADKGVGLRLRDELPNGRGVVRLCAKNKHLHPARLMRGGDHAVAA